MPSGGIGLLAGIVEFGLTWFRGMRCLGFYGGPRLNQVELGRILPALDSGAGREIPENELRGYLRHGFGDKNATPAHKMSQNG